ncbi:hypothetical protein [Bifidobacterium leontopitheci]|nr:hypothetical protein [Bifidobacterium leontopitheci]
MADNAEHSLQSGEKSKRRKKTVWLCLVVSAIVVVLVVAVAVVSLWVIPASKRAEQAAQEAADIKAAPAKITKVDTACDTKEAFSETAINKEIMVTEDGGKSLTLLSGKDSDKKAVECVLKNFGMPDDLRSRILNAKMDDGLKTERWKGMDVTWIYNDNSGLQLTVEAVGSEPAANSAQ